MRARETLVLSASLFLAVLVPAGLASWAHARLAAVTAALSKATAVPVRAGDAEMTLMGSLRLDGLALGDAFRAESVEASVGMANALRGRFAADEIRVVSPQLSGRLEADGSLDAAELLDRLRAARRRARPDAGGVDGGTRKLRRIVVTDGALLVSLGEGGEVRAHGVEIHPQEGGVRVIARDIAVSVVHPQGRAEARFGRAGVDLELPGLAVSRAALDGGRITVSAPEGAPLSLADVVLARKTAAVSETRIEGVLEGTRRRVRLDVTESGGRRELVLKADQLPLSPFRPLLPGWIDPRGTATGTLKVALSAGGETVDVTLEGKVEDVLLAHEVVGKEPLPLEGRLWASGTARSRGESRIAFEVKSGDLAVDGTASWARRDEGALVHADLDVKLLPVACAAALASVPRPLREPLDGMDMMGQVAGRARVVFAFEDPNASVFDVDLDVGCKVLAEPAGANVKALRGAHVHRLPNGKTRTLSGDDEDFVELSALPRHVWGAFVAGEDAAFFRHQGFDPHQLEKSFQANVAARKIERGGSTMSQQLIKNLYLSRERTLSRKLLEAVLTWRLEAEVSKERILEIYLNVIELGEDTYGLAPASRLWFHKDPHKLTVAEAAFLAALTPAPLSSHAKIRALGDIDPATRGRMESILRSMRRNGYVSERAYAEARRARLDLRL